ncbi:uncharacterized protein FOMMEDRAFT_168216 [Fomitiporia mediterranea MF3/22]|uniref:uncharacterized protein n=1 Tax=Fomitiporia mediterranea (strain MF3/22) TaxID=694068 RepID=UPI00044074C9|nr:uncharacterized protein FOMMEDRAFT_168216 [Fomitiporia mediterranea MF3/22]EJD03177.1 hypothetical protein FOMMEDRAFT_168216 [Fomitiporia mediterranea MF3/22]
MAYYDAYRNAPGWGTSNYQFLSPMQPSYQPQPSWTGVDYYRAHGGLADPGVYDYAWNRVRNRSSMGIGMEDARILHRRAYGGLGDIQMMLPSDVGAAAAYEAWRNWKYHNGIYAQPLAGDRERQREALIGLAVSEATRLWQYTGRAADTYGRLEACESAGATADQILEQAWLLEGGGAYDPYPGRGRLSRRGSASSLRSYSPLSPGMPVVGSIGHSRSRPASPFLGDGYGYASSSAYSPSAYSTSAYDAPYSRRRAYSNAAAYPMNYGTPMTTQSQYLQPTTYQSGYYGQPLSPTYAAAQPNVTVIQPPSSHRHHRSHSRHRHRSGSRHRSSRHRHSGSYGSYGGNYYVGNSVPYGVGY